MCKRTGKALTKTWFDELDAQAAAKVATATSRLEPGYTSSTKWFDSMGGCVTYRGPGYRVYLAKDGHSLIILFGGGNKRGQQRDIDRAKALHIEYKARKKRASADAERTQTLTKPPNQSKKHSR